MTSDPGKGGADLGVRRQEEAPVFPRPSALLRFQRGWIVEETVWESGGIYRFLGHRFEIAAWFPELNDF